jgi:hypothetical protein
MIKKYQLMINQLCRKKDGLWDRNSKGEKNNSSIAKGTQFFFY